MDRGTWQATVHGVARIEHNLAAKPNQTKPNQTKPEGAWSRTNGGRDLWLLSVSSQQHLFSDASFWLYPHNTRAGAFTWSSGLGALFPQRASFLLHRAFFLASDNPNPLPFFFSSENCHFKLVIIQRDNIWFKLKSHCLGSIGFYVFSNVLAYSLCILRSLNSSTFWPLSGADLLLWNASRILEPIFSLLPTPSVFVFQ